METRDVELIRKVSRDNTELRKLYDEHLEFERQIEELKRHHPQTDAIHFEIERIKKLKLKGKDQMERILTRYR